MTNPWLVFATCLRRKYDETKSVGRKKTDDNTKLSQGESDATCAPTLK